jgi:hypothetical protein
MLVAASWFLPMSDKVMVYMRHVNVGVKRVA